MPETLTEAQIRAVEGRYPQGLTSQQLVSVFQQHEIRFSEANLRRYVQLGLVPRSRRVGQKGKHLGSLGVYPTRAVRRINTIKRLMADRFTLEEIRARFLTFKDGIENLDEALGELLSVFARRIEDVEPSPHRTRLFEELSAIKAAADELLLGIQRVEKLLISGDPSRPRGGGAASPTELL
jgi:DNA-binding transcriptional MerR regulator